MPRKLTGALIQEIAASKKLSEQELAGLRSVNATIHIGGITEWERRLYRISGGNPEIWTSLGCVGSCRHDLESIIATPIAKVRTGIRQSFACVDCGSTRHSTTNSLGKTLHDYEHPELYDALREEFAPAEARALLRARDWYYQLCALALKCEAGATVDLEEEGSITPLFNPQAAMAAMKRQPKAA